MTEEDSAATSVCGVASLSAASALVVSSTFVSSPEGEHQAGRSLTAPPVMANGDDEPAKAEKAVDGLYCVHYRLVAELD